MHILHLVHQYLPDDVGGTELYTRSLARAQAARGHAAHVFYRRSVAGAGGELDEREDAGVRVWGAWDGPPTPARRFAATFRAPRLDAAFARALDAAQPDLVHVQHLMGLPVSLVRRVRERGIPFVVTLHDYWWVCANAQLLTNYDATVCEGPRAGVNCARCALARAGHGAWWPAAPLLAPVMLWRNAALCRIVQAASALIAPTAFVRDWYVAHGAPAGKLRVIPHGIAAPAALPRTPHAGVRFAVIGGLTWQKGVHVAVEAFAAAFAGSHAGVELWIAGDERADPGYVARLRDLATPGVRFLGRLSRAQVWATLAQVDALLVPSLWYETFSLIVREAFAAGVPVLVSDLGALAEAVREGVDGLRVPPGDVVAWAAALRRLAEDAALREFLRAGVRPPLTLDAHVERVEALVQEVGGARDPLF